MRKYLLLVALLCGCGSHSDAPAPKSATADWTRMTSEDSSIGILMPRTWENRDIPSAIKSGLEKAKSDPSRAKGLKAMSSAAANNEYKLMLRRNASKPPFLATLVVISSANPKNKTLDQLVADNVKYIKGEGAKPTISKATFPAGPCEEVSYDATIKSVRAVVRHETYMFLKGTTFTAVAFAYRPNDAGAKREIPDMMKSLTLG